MSNFFKAGSFALGAVLGVSLATPALAADKFPKRPLSMVVPYGPGGGSGQVSRAMAQGVTEATGVSIKLVYKPGGSGLVGLKSYM
ncbi:MAG: hypothetical protein ACKVHL_11395, partial [Rhodospirillales bacterium]